MTLEQLLDRGRTRSIFLWSIGGIVALLLVIRYFVLPRYEPSLAQGGLPIAAKLLEDVSATIVVTVLVSLFLWWITPSRVRNSGIEMVEPRELPRHFAEALANSSNWCFVGGCGRYFRSAVLQEMTRRARQESTSKSVSAVILNPENDLLCKRHARYRSGTKRGQKEGNWTKVRVKQELLATIVIAKAVAKRQGLIDVRIYLSDHYSSFRLDISQVCAIETREDSTAPALRSNSGSYYFSALNDEFRIAMEQAKPVIEGETECAAVTDLASLKTAIAALKMPALGLTDPQLEEVVKLVLNISNPYE
jgi:hypothetical protein